MYRAITYKVRLKINPKVLDCGIPLANEKLNEIYDYVKTLRLGCLSDSSVTIDGKDVSSFLRTPEVNQNVSFIAAFPPIRAQVLTLQQSIGNDPSIPGIVMDGRDIGTVVFPNAQLKIFLVADPKVRAERRAKELGQSGFTVSVESIMNDLLARDKLDSERATAPLKKAVDAVELDTSQLTFQQQVDEIVSLAKQRISSE